MSDLSDFVLSYYQLHGALVEPPRYGVHEALLPEELAAQLETPTWQQLVFDQSLAEEDAGQLHLAIGHPLVERIVELARREPAPTQAYINSVRLDKHGLIELAFGGRIRQSQVAHALNGPGGTGRAEFAGEFHQPDFEPVDQLLHLGQTALALKRRESRFAPRRVERRGVNPFHVPSESVVDCRHCIKWLCHCCPSW